MIRLKNKMLKHLTLRYISSALLTTVSLLVVSTLFFPVLSSAHQLADPGAGGATTTTQTSDQSSHYCGDDPKVYTGIDLGCKGEGNPIADMIFAIIRILSDGVGLVVIGSIIVAGIQYSASAGDPQATAAAVGRIRSSIFALFLFLFSYAILNYLIPGQFLK